MRLVTEQRRNEVFASLSRDGSLSVSELAKRLDVTMETIRKDIQFWESKGVLKKIHGGAIISNDEIVRHISMRISENMEAKKRVADKAFKLLPEKGVVFLDCGSTIPCLARLLFIRSGLTIVTNSLIVANTLLDSKHNVHMAGGQLRSDTSGAVGMWAENNLKNIRIDLAVLGTSGFKGFDGPAVEEFSDAEVKRVVMERSSETIVIADNTKFTSSGLVSYCNWDKVSKFITNPGPEVDKELLTKISAATEVILTE